MSIRVEVLTAAEEAVSTLRNSAYGEPEDSFSRIALFWDEYLFQKNPSARVALKPHDVAVMMVLMKIARLVHDPAHKDSWIDIAGYAACGAEAAKVGTSTPNPYAHYLSTLSKMHWNDDFYADNVKPQEEMP